MKRVKKEEVKTESATIGAFKKEFDVCAIGNAMVDVLAYADASLLKKHGLTKGSTTLIDEQKAAALYKEMGAATECSGGSAGNTISGIASLGAKTAYIGKVRNDKLGEIFKHDMRAQGIYYNTLPAVMGKSTAQCLVFVTSDGDSKVKSKNVERTMATFLGACQALTRYDIDSEIIRNSKVCYAEGYLWDIEDAREAVRKAVYLAHENNRVFAFTLSDPFCVTRHREEFMELLTSGSIDILFANEHEITAMFEETNLQKILMRLSKLCRVAACVTRSSKGSVIVDHEGNVYDIEAERVAEVYDVTGAGDLYAAGVLYGYVQGYDWYTCGRLGSLAASEVIKYLGGRPLTKLSTLLEKI
ncbi:MAG: adenosine kinase [Proteobacteria bacterium]|nr:adenosine kinase [Pseudomonadota bacterium]